MAGGVLKGFGISFIVLGSLGVLVGLLAAAFGAYVANEEDQRGLFADRDKAEGGVFLGMGGLALAAVGLVVLVLGIVLTVWGAGRARAGLMKAVASPTPVQVVPSGTPWAQAPPVEAPRAPPGPLAAERRSGMDWRVPVAVLVAAAVVVALLSFAQPGGPGAGSPGASSVQTTTVEGTFQDFRTPLGNRLGGDPQHEMRLEGEGPFVARASLNWTAAPGSATLVLVLEGQQQGTGEWVVLGQQEGGPGLIVEAGPVELQNLLRARISFPESGGAGSVDYALTLTALSV